MPRVNDNKPMTLLITKSQFYELSELDSKGIVIWTSHFDTLEEAEDRAKKLNQDIICHL
jgi:hypothetical protein